MRAFIQHSDVTIALADVYAEIEQVRSEINIARSNHDFNRASALQHNKLVVLSKKLAGDEARIKKKMAAAQLAIDIDNNDNNRLGRGAAGIVYSINTVQYSRNAAKIYYPHQRFDWQRIA